MRKLISTLMLDMIKNTEGAVIMNALGHLEKMLLAGEITEEQYKERKAIYVETILEMYIKGIISKEQMQEKLNK